MNELDTLHAVDDLINAARGFKAAEIPFEQHQVATINSLFEKRRDLSTLLARHLRSKATFQDHESCTGTTAIWEVFSDLFHKQGRYFETLLISFELYHSMLEQERSEGRRIHKGMPLVRIADAYGKLGYASHEERFLMLTLCEDAIRGEGIISPSQTGIYYRLVWGVGYSDRQVRQYAQDFYNAYLKKPAHKFFPEGLLQDIDQQQRWLLRPPAEAEMPIYEISRAYLEFLLNNLGDGSGQVLERLAEYVMSCMAGCRAQRRVHSEVTEYDVVCSMNGNHFDFRTEFGRYFVCECKDWNKRAGISVLAKFCRILDATKARFGILFSSAGLSGMDDASRATREQQKIFQDRGLVIVVVDATDIRHLIEGANFIRMLRHKYEVVRLDLNSKRHTFAG
jgi:hypothetical protein